jgi:hypothetical protein
MCEIFSQALRRAIRGWGMTRYALSARTGIDQSTLSKFVKGQRGLSLGAVDRLIVALDLELRPRKRKGE